MFCTDFTLRQETSSRINFEPLRCKCWHCEYCAPKRRWQLIRDALRGKPNTFLTLTVNPNFKNSPTARAKALVVSWRKLTRLAKKKYGYEKIPFFAVFEKTKRGEPHLHILLRVKWLDQRWISAQMQRFMGSPIVDIRRITSKKKMARYVAKYCGKDPHLFKGTKRYWRSLDWFFKGNRPEDDYTAKPENYSVTKARIETLAKGFFEQGHFVYWTEKGFFILKETPFAFQHFTPNGKRRRRELAEIKSLQNNGYQNHA